MKPAPRSGGFTLVEVLVALVIVALGLTALMVAVNGTARTSGFLRDKTLAQWIALNRLTEVRLNMVKFGQNTDTGELDFGNRKWHYDTRYFDTSIASMKRVTVRVYLGDAKTKGNPVAQAVGFLGTSLAAPGSLIVDWTAGISLANGAGTGGTPTGTQPGQPVGTQPGQPIGTQPGQPIVPQPNPPGVPPTTP
ncbi:MAG TPA: type II secretion system minor pseudopilin GspI [Steroidobacteraceae bacterium]|nr:type II secretion system minor pseudopilin GspI [Steroidobacteraceae bacterium]